MKGADPAGVAVAGCRPLDGGIRIAARRPGGFAPACLVARRCAVLMALAVMVRATGIAQEPPARLVQGRVTDSAGVPVPYVNVRVGPVRVVTNDSGRFRLPLQSRTSITLEVRRLGFEPANVALPAGGDTSLFVTLTPVAHVLREALVQQERLRTLERRGFYSRLQDREKGINIGYFVTPEDLERRQPPLTTMLLEGIPGVRVSRVGGNCQFIQRCYMPTGPGGCRFTIFLDGARITGLSAGPSARGDFLDELLAPSTIAGIEVYTRGVRAPPQFQTLSGNCGVVVIWTK